MYVYIILYLLHIMYSSDVFVVWWVCVYRVGTWGGGGGGAIKYLLCTYVVYVCDTHQNGAVG